MSKKTPFLKRKLNRKSVLIVYGVTLIVFLLLLLPPTGKAVFFPGKLYAADEFVLSTFPSLNTGRFSVVSVVLYQRLYTIDAVPSINANPSAVIAAWLYPGAHVFPVSDFIDENTTQYIYAQRVEHIAADSQIVPIVAGLREANVSFAIHGNGVLVTGFVENASAKGQLQNRDVIVEADGTYVGTIETLRAILEQNSHARINVSVQRGNTVVTVPVSVKEGKIGITAVTQNVSVQTGNDTIQIEENLGGSWDLGLALHVYSLVTHQDLTKGRHIVASGYMNENGTVLGVGAMSLKAKTVGKNDVALFLVAKEDEQQARTLTDVPVVGVGSLREAIEYLSIT